MTQIKGVHITTIHNPRAYTPEQIERMCLIAGCLDRGELQVCEMPTARCEDVLGEDGCDACIRLREDA